MNYEHAGMLLVFLGFGVFFLAMQVLATARVAYWLRGVYGRLDRLPNPTFPTEVPQRRPPRDR
jgi:hypothetical protein